MYFGVSVDCMLMALSSILLLVKVSESLPIYVSVFKLPLVCFFVCFIISLGMFQIVLLTEVSGTVSFCINVQSACSMSHSESMTYVR